MFTLALLLSTATPTPTTCQLLQQRWDDVQKDMVYYYNYHQDGVRRFANGYAKSGSYYLLGKQREYEQQSKDKVEEQMQQGDRILALMIANKCPVPSKPLSPFAEVD